MSEQEQNELVKRFRSDLESLLLETLHKAGQPYGAIPDDIEDTRVALDEAVEDFILGTTEEHGQ